MMPVQCWIPKIGQLRKHVKVKVENQQWWQEMVMVFVDDGDVGDEDDYVHLGK